jgi:hypothetical protein
MTTAVFYEKVHYITENFIDVLSTNMWKFHESYHVISGGGDDSVGQ